MGHCRKIYCPLMYLNPFGFAMTKLKTPPGSTETYKIHKHLGKSFALGFVESFVYSSYFSSVRLLQ